MVRHAGVGLEKPDTDIRTAAARALPVFLRITRAWGLGAEQAAQLLGCGRSTLYRWMDAPEKVELSADQLERLSYVLGIYKALQILYPTPENADGWVKRPNRDSLFAGHAPIERMLGGQVADLYVVRQYLDGQRGG